MIWLSIRYILYDMVLRPIIIRGSIYGIEAANRIIQKAYKKKSPKGNPETKK
jgi:hypothetical protein